MESNNGLGGPKIALLIDFDNVVLGIDDPGFDVELVVNALRERGNIVLGRVYGDWYRHNRHRRKLMEQGLELVETPAFGPVIKNSADIRIALDGFEIAMTHDYISTFCIVSGDSDFLPLIKKLQALGKNVLVICGARFTSDMLRRNCNEFIAYENLLAASVGATEDATTLEGAFLLLQRAMAALRERGTEIRTSTLKQMMLQLNPVFSERTFGCSQFRQFLDRAVANNLIKLGPRDRVSGELYVLAPDDDPAELLENVDARDNSRDNGRDNGRSRSSREDRRDERREERRDERRDERREEPKVESRVERDETDDNGEAPLRRPRLRSGLRRRVRSDASTFAETSAENAVEAPAESSTESFGEAPAEAATGAIIALPDVVALEAEQEEIGEHASSRTELISRGMRPGRLRFSGRSSRVEAAPTSETPVSDETTSFEAVGATVETAAQELESPVEVPEIADSSTETVVPEAEATEAQASTTEPTSKASTGEPADAERPKTRSRRRSTSRKKAAATEQVAEFEAASPIAEAETAASTESTLTDSTPEEPKSETATAEAADTQEPTAEAAGETAAEESEKPKRRTRKRTTSKAAAKPTAEASQTVETTENAAAEENTDAAPEVSSEAEPAKPKRRRTTRRKTTKATDKNGETANGETSNTEVAENSAE